MSKLSTMKSIMFAAVDMDCDGPSTTVYRVTVPTDWHEDLIKRKLVQWVGTYFHESDYFALELRDLSVEQMNESWRDCSAQCGLDECGLAHLSFNGKPAGWER